MEKYPKPSKDLIGKKIRILHSNSANWIQIHQVYTVENVTPEGKLLINGLYWACFHNPTYHYFEVVEEEVDLNKLMLNLDILIQEKERRDVKRVKRLFRRQQSKAQRHGT